MTMLAHFQANFPQFERNLIDLVQHFLNISIELDAVSDVASGFSAPCFGLTVQPLLLSQTSEYKTGSSFWLVLLIMRKMAGRCGWRPLEHITSSSAEVTHGCRFTFRNVLQVNTH